MSRAGMTPAERFRASYAGARKRVHKAHRPHRCGVCGQTEHNARTCNRCPDERWAFETVRT